MKNQELEWLLQEKYNGVKSVAFDADCARLDAGEPLAYIIGSVPFLDCTIYLDSHPLIPRPETEYRVEKAIFCIKQHVDDVSKGRTPNLRDGIPKILDLCAGSGAIGVAVAKAIPEASVTFAEIDPVHLATIKKNLISNVPQYPNRLGYYPVIESDLFSKVSGQFDFILTNPPYIDRTAGTVEASVEEFEPHLALFGGTSGMEIIERIIASAKERLTPDTGQLWIEHEPSQSAAIASLATTHGFTITTHLDQYGTERYSILTPLVAK